jgi:heterodisulfide reductase subunit A-like polyferredoxin
MGDRSAAHSANTSRRRFLKIAGASALAVAARNALAIASTERKTHGGTVDAIVVGGGFAGVTAARELGREGL